MKQISYRIVKNTNGVCMWMVKLAAPSSILATTEHLRTENTCQAAALQ